MEENPYKSPPPATDETTANSRSSLEIANYLLWQAAKAIGGYGLILWALWIRARDDNEWFAKQVIIYSVIYAVVLLVFGIRWVVGGARRK